MHYLIGVLFLIFSAISTATINKNVSVSYTNSSVSISYIDAAWGDNVTGAEIYTCTNDSNCDTSYLSMKTNGSKKFDINAYGIFKIEVKGDVKNWYGSVIKSTVLWEQIVVNLQRADNSLKDSVNKYAPIFSFFKDESYFPVTIDNLFNRWISDFSITSENKNYSQSDKVNDFMRSNGHMNGKVIMNKDIAKTIKGDKNNYPVYWYVEFNDSVAYVTYFTLYAFDQKFNEYIKAGIGESKGEHSIDRESFTIKFVKNSAAWIPDEVVYAGHLPNQPTTFLGCDNPETCQNAGFLSTKWNGGKNLIKWPTVAKIGNNPIVYVAHGSHAVTPAFGWYHLQVDNWKCPQNACDVTEPSGSREISSFKKGYLEEIDLNDQKHSALTYSGFLIQGADEPYRIFPFIRNPVQSWVLNASTAFNDCVQNKQGCEAYINKFNILDHTPKQATVGELTNFTVTGEGFNSNMAYTVAGCANITKTELTATTLKFNCTPQEVGDKFLTIKDKPDGIPLYNEKVVVTEAKTTTTCTGATNSVICEDFDGSVNVGTANGVTFINSPNGKAASFTRSSESRIQYPFSKGLPKEGTLEFVAKIDSMYRYNNSSLITNENCALLFTTDIQGGDVTWAGSAWLYVCNNGDVSFHIAGEKYEAGWNAKYRLAATGTSFRFGEWHKIGVSYGSQGRYLTVDGQIVASNTTQTQLLGAGGNHSSPIDTPTIGEPVSGFWKNNQWEGGFEGAVDAFRASSTQKDWHLSK